MIWVRRHDPGEVCPTVSRWRGGLPVADRSTGYAPTVITVRDRRLLRLAGVRWLTALLGFNGYERCWALYDPAGFETRLSVAEWNRTLRSPGEVCEAQLWAAQFIEASDLVRQERAAAGPGWLEVPPAPVRVTEWRVVLFGVRSFYAPLCNVTSVGRLPVRDVLAATGADCGCGDDGGERG